MKELPDPACGLVTVKEGHVAVYQNQVKFNAVKAQSFLGFYVMLNYFQGLKTVKAMLTDCRRVDADLIL